MDHNHPLSSYGDSYGVLERCLMDILAVIKPSENDQLKRLCTINEIVILARSVDSLKDAVIRPFGSFISNLYTKWGDLDTSVELSHSSPSSTGKKRKQNALRDMMKVLRKNGVAHKFTFIPNARVPVLKYESSLHNVSCDVSIDNHMGWMKSKILLRISEIDERFRDMVLLTKEWAKAHNINDPTLGTLNSYSICLLVIFHFQTCTPAILPPLKDIYDGNIVGITGSWSTIEKQIEDACTANAARFKRFRQRNPSTLCQLLISFFVKFSKIESLSSEYAICTYTGQWERLTSNPRWLEKSHGLLVEDPFERPDNAARAVRSRELSIISEAFMTTSQKLPSYSFDMNSLFDILLRPSVSSQLKIGTSQSRYSRHRGHEKPLSVYANHNNHEKVQVAFSGPAKRGDRQSQSSSSPIAGRKKAQAAFSGYAKRVANNNSESENSSIVNGKNIQSRSSNHAVATYENPPIGLSGTAGGVYNNRRKSRSPNSTVVQPRQGSFSIQGQQVWRPRNLDK